MWYIWFRKGEIKEMKECDRQISFIQSCKHWKIKQSLKNEKKNVQL